MTLRRLTSVNKLQTATGTEDGMLFCTEVLLADVGQENQETLKYQEKKFGVMMDTLRESLPVSPLVRSIIRNLLSCILIKPILQSRKAKRLRRL